MNVLIIEDEKHARNVLFTLLTEECPSINEIYQAPTLKEGVSIIRSNKPALVFLDIEMPNESGLNILKYFTGETISFKIIFTTGYSKYAVEAFKSSAIDYLLKPIDSDELKYAVNKAEQSIEKSFIEDHIKDLERSFKQLSVNKIALDMPSGIRLISIDEILYFEADHVYTKVYLTQGKTELICKTLKHFTTQLSDNPIFYKPHRSYLLNLKFMEKIVKRNGLHVVMQNQRTIPIARERKKDFLDMVKKYF